MRTHEISGPGTVATLGPRFTRLHVQSCCGGFHFTSALTAPRPGLPAPAAGWPRDMGGGASAGAPFCTTTRHCWLGTKEACDGVRTEDERGEEKTGEEVQVTWMAIASGVSKSGYLRRDGCEETGV